MDQTKSVINPKTPVTSDMDLDLRFVKSNFSAIVSTVGSNFHQFTHLISWMLNGMNRITFNTQSQMWWYRQETHLAHRVGHSHWQKWWNENLLCLPLPVKTNANTQTGTKCENYAIYWQQYRKKAYSRFQQNENTLHCPSAATSSWVVWMACDMRESGHVEFLISCHHTIRLLHKILSAACIYFILAPPMGKIKPFPCMSGIPWR